MHITDLGVKLLITHLYWLECFNSLYLVILPAMMATPLSYAGQTEIRLRTTQLLDDEIRAKALSRRIRWVPQMRSIDAVPMCSIANAITLTNR